MAEWEFGEGGMTVRMPGQVAFPGGMNVYTGIEFDIMWLDIFLVWGYTPSTTIRGMHHDILRTYTSGVRESGFLHTTPS